MGGRERLSAGSHQFHKLTLGEPSACCPQQRHGIAHKPRLAPFVVLLPPLQDLLVEAADRVGCEIVLDPAVELLANTKEPKLVEKNPQIKRVSRLRAGRWRSA